MMESNRNLFKNVRPSVLNKVQIMKKESYLKLFNENDDSKDSNFNFDDCNIDHMNINNQNKNGWNLSKENVDKVLLTSES